MCSGRCQVRFAESGSRLVVDAQWFLLGTTGQHVIQRGRLIRFGYNILFTVFFWMSAPFYLLKMVRRGNWRAGFFQRFGIFSKALRSRLGESDSVVWIHAVSVGEVNQCVPLQRELEKMMPDQTWVVSTTTSTGMVELEKKLPGDVLKLYYPADFAGAVRRSLKCIHPRMIVLIEAEVWPNMMWAATDSRIPVALVNARLSDRSFERYLKTSFLFAPLFESLAVIGAQSIGDVERWRQLGCQADRISMTGNIKFDSVQLEPSGRVDVRALLDELGVSRAAKIIVGGSTHDGEEAMLARVFKRLRAEGLEVILIVVPRHMERGVAVQADVENQDLRAVRRSMFRLNRVDLDHQVDCLIVDTTGELIDFYAAADVVFVGKSLAKGGGQNPIEPAALGKPVVFGEKMSNFRDIVRILLGSKASIVVVDERSLEDTMLELMRFPGKIEQLGKAATDCVMANRGSLGKTAQLLCGACGKISKKTIDQATNIP